LGHALANHTYSHPFGLCNLSTEKIKEEIEKCDIILRELTGIKPIGFRTPGYAVNTTIINTLSSLNYKYDSSAGWPLIHQILLVLKAIKPVTGMKMDIGHGETNIRFYNEPYFTSSENWGKKSKGNEEVMEYPLPHSYKLFPYYNNILLGSSNKRITTLTKGLNTRHLVFLMHQIEFCDSTDKFLPKSIHKHPNVLQNYTSKSGKMDFTFDLLKNKYNFTLLENEF
jgi:peptidoglycan/xylan/chitin deacetylase (PgdA/CDA1 family)